MVHVEEMQHFVSHQSSFYGIIFSQNFLLMITLKYVEKAMNCFIVLHSFFRILTINVARKIPRGKNNLQKWNIFKSVSFTNLLGTLEYFIVSSGFLSSDFNCFIWHLPSVHKTIVQNFCLMTANKITRLIKHSPNIPSPSKVHSVQLNNT